MNNFKIAVIDDEADIVESIQFYFKEYGVTGFTDSNEALDFINNNYYDIIISDYKMPGTSGVQLLMSAKEHNSYGHGILLTAYADKNLLEQSLNKGLVTRLLEKPLDLKQLKKVVLELLEDCKQKKEEKKKLERLEVENSLLKEKLQEKQTLIGYDKGLKHVYKQITSVAKYNVSVLISGETGTGKEVTARTIHNLSSRKDKPFITVNCGAIPEHLIESELFGHIKGAFTGANQTRTGKFELAEGGTIFLDEIGELPLAQQVALLRVLQEKEICKVGENKTIKVDIRVVAATNRDLEKEIEKGTFREDLFYRLNEFPLFLPPLRERKNDIADLASYFITKFSAELNTQNITISGPAIERLQQFYWKGNVRELENVIKRVLITLEGKIIEPGNFDFIVSRGELSVKDILDFIRKNIFDGGLSLKKLNDMIIKDILDSCEGNVSNAVKKSGIKRDQFYKFK